MIAGYEAGIGSKQVARIFQWAVGIPIVYSFLLATAGLEYPDPALLLVQTLISDEWWARVTLLAIAAVLQVSDFAMKAGEQDYEHRVHEILKAIGDRLRTGSAVETAVTEACRIAKGPSDVFEHAIELSDEMPFEDALRVAADSCGSAYLREVSYLVAEAVQSSGDTGSAIRRLGMELERNAQFETSIQSKVSNPLTILWVVGVVVVPPLYALLRYSFNNYNGEVGELHPAPMLFFLYGAIAISMFDGLIFGEWERLFARLPFAVGMVYIGLHWI